MTDEPDDREPALEGQTIHGPQPGPEAAIGLALLVIGTGLLIAVLAGWIPV